MRMSAGVSDTHAQQVLEEYLAALEAGRAPEREAFLAAHPDVAEPLRAALQALDFVHHAGRKLKPAQEVPTDPGQLLGDYRLVREVGRGGMAVVYEAQQVSLGRRVALKVLPFAAVLDAKQLQRFQHEAQAAAHLQHTNIVPVYSVGCERGVHYYAMQFVDGASLADAIRELRGGPKGSSPTPISTHASNREPGFIRTAARLGVMAAEALDHAHQVGIVHRDVKPGNLMVDGAGTLWVTDFGLARTVSDAALTMTGELLGTLRYMSPEQALAKRAPVDHRTDIYSLGATLYELFTLEPAFRGDEPHEVILQVASRDPVPPRRLNPTLPQDLETIVLKAMAKDPRARYATAQEMADDLRRFLDDRAILARRPTIFQRANRWARRHATLVGAAAIVLLMGVIALAVSVHRIARSEKRTEDALHRAETSLGFAHGAVDRFLTEIGIFGVADEPPLPGSARKLLLERALEFYDTFLEDRHEARAQANRGRILNALRRYEQALAAFDRAIEFDPNLAEAHSGRGVMLARLGRLDDALAACDRAIEFNPASTMSHGNRGFVLAQQGRFDDALAAYDRAIELDPNLAHAHTNRGLALARLGRLDDALAACDRAAALEPRLPVAHASRGYVLRRQGRFEEALAASDRAIELDATLAPAHDNRGHALAQLGRFEEALAALDRSLELDPSSALTHELRGQVLAQVDRFEEALAASDRAIELDATLASAHDNRGHALTQLGRFEEALAALDRALELDPRLPEAHADRGNALRLLDRSEEALAACDRAIELDPSFQTAHHNRGLVLMELDRLDDALTALDRALEIEPTFARTHENRGRVLMELGRFEEALAAFDRAIEFDPRLPRAHEGRGIACMYLGRIEEALAAWERALALGLRSGSVAGNIARVRATSADPKLRDTARAVEMARLAVELKPDDGAYRNTLGVALYRAGSWREALDALEKSMELRSGGDAYDWFFVAMAQWQIGKKEDARRWCKKAVAWTDANEPDDEELGRFRAEAKDLVGIE